MAGWRSVAAALVLAVLSLTACGESNPLIGEWRLDDKNVDSMVKSALNVAGAGSSVIVFTADKMISGDQAKPVSYDVAGDRVVVTAKGESDGQVYQIVDNRYFDIQLPLGMTLRYAKVAVK